MSDIITKACDYYVHEADAPCGLPVPHNLSTPLTFGTGAYEVDLCEKHQAVLADELKPYIKLGRKIRNVNVLDKTGRRVLRSKSGRTFTVTDVRKWLEETGRAQPNAGRGGRIADADIQEFMKLQG